MRITYSRHARDQMEERAITEQHVEQVLAFPDRLVEGVTADEYNAVVEGRPLRVVMARNTDPSLVITVMIASRERG
ncbi:MAG: DUF4258 domain-containing protein [Chloroflexota bacterium]|nr:DUF4258 domain-containing protein [Chloroflexota bacterium]